MMTSNPFVMALRAIRLRPLAVAMVGCGICGLGFFAATAARGESLATASLSPSPGMKDVCPDTPLRIEFADVPVLGAGKVQVFDASNDAVVETVDVTVPKLTKVIGGFPNFNYYPVILAGKNAAIYLPDHALAYDRSYYVKIDA